MSAILPMPRPRPPSRTAFCTASLPCVGMILSYTNRRFHLRNVTDLVRNCPGRPLTPYGQMTRSTPDASWAGWPGQPLTPRVADHQHYHIPQSLGSLSGLPELAQPSIIARDSVENPARATQDAEGTRPKTPLHTTHKSLEPPAR